MSCGTLETFIQKTLDVAQEFALNNQCRIVYETEDHILEEYNREGSPQSENNLYYISSDEIRKLSLRFYKVNDEEFRLVIDRGCNSISLTLNQNLERKTTYPSDDFNLMIDDTIGDFKARLMTCLYMMWDLKYALRLLCSDMRTREII
jgi:hypothetical protein